MWWLLRSCHWRADTTCLHNLIYPVQSDLSIQFCYDPTNPDVSYYFIFDLLPHKEFYDLLAPSGALLFIMGYNIWHCVSMSAWFCPTAVAKFLRLYITQFSIFFKFGAILPIYNRPVHQTFFVSIALQFAPIVSPPRFYVSMLYCVLFCEHSRYLQASLSSTLVHGTHVGLFVERAQIWIFIGNLKSELLGKVFWKVFWVDIFCPLAT